jgi:delta24(24(1))-sterol reductase
MLISNPPIGLPVPSLNYKALTYHCNALSSFYTTIIISLTLHFTGLFHLPSLIEHFGSLMTWAIIISFFFTGLIYFLAVNFNYGGKPMRMSGNLIYDIFMGASLNPRLFTSEIFKLGRKEWQGVDLKMFAEVRVPWVLLFMIAVSGAFKQYEDFGRVTPVSIVWL